MKKLKLLALSLIACSILSCKKNDVLLAEGTTEDAANASLASDAFGLAHSEYGKLGPYAVSTNAVRGDCRLVVGRIYNVLSHIGLLDRELECNPAFPVGFNHPITTEVFYPSNIQSLDKLPVVNFVGGILSNVGNYNRLAELWASYGFIVVNSNDFLNITPAMHVYGAIELTNLNKDPQSPLFGKVDLSRIIMAGHSMGGGASLAASTLPQAALNLIDPAIRVVGTLPLEPSPFAIHTAVRSRTLLLTGALDPIVPAMSWPILQALLLRNTPSWTATAKFATHFSPTLELFRNEFAGISVAWILYTGKNDVNASRYFLGRNYRLLSDEQFIQGGGLPLLAPLRVQRNNLADALPAL